MAIWVAFLIVLWVVDAAAFRTYLLTLSQEGEAAVLEFVRNNEATDVIYTLEESENLGPDAVWSALPVVTESTNPFVDHEVITFPLNATAGAKCFFAFPDRDCF